MKDKGEISIDNFRRLIEWFKERNINNFSLLGGEPTQYSNFNEINKIAKDFEVVLLTNGLFKDIETNNINTFVINCNLPESYTKEEMELFISNIKKIKEKGQNIVLRHNIINHNTPYEFIFDLCKEFDVKNISYSITTPNSDKTNKFTDFEHKDELSHKIISFVKECVKNNIHPGMSRPIPFCLFNYKDRRFMLHHGGMIETCHPTEGVYVVNPDMSVYPCCALHFKGPNILDLNNEKDISDHYSKKIKDLKWSKHIFSKCTSCIYLKRKTCHGGCLTYKL
jgi:radical SAM protein with 4Fe4S-binding SPASM domain